MRLQSKTISYILIILVLTSCFFITQLAPIPQDVHYHDFSDQRHFGFIPNFWNVMSNIAFLWVGILGLVQLHWLKQLKIIEELKYAYYIFFIAVAAVSFGSGYYHWQPTNATLVWDRLPMTFGFMSLLSITLAEFLKTSYAKILLIPLTVLGLFSVVYWHISEQNGAGDLRLYILIQFLPILVLLILLTFAHTCFNMRSGYWWLFLCYGLAKLSEYFDAEIFELTHGYMAGHALKHLLAAVGLYLLLRYFKQRVYLHNLSGKI
ncbi:membrane protein [Gammaproteobacteria bacterium]|nr:membrane protein [Gammaproteobacteria bacterium]